MEDNKNNSFEAVLKTLNLQNSKLIGTNQYIGGDLTNDYPNLKNIVSLNFGNCVGFFFSHENKFLFIHSDLPRINEVDSVVEQFFGSNIVPNTTLCFYHSYNGNINRSEEQVKNALPKFNFQFINADSIKKENSVFDLFIEVDNCRKGNCPSYYCLEHDSYIQYGSDFLESDHYLNGNKLRNYGDEWEAGIHVSNFLENSKIESPDRIEMGNKASIFSFDPLKNITDKFIDKWSLIIGPNSDIQNEEENLFNEKPFVFNGLSDAMKKEDFIDDLFAKFSNKNNPTIEEKYPTQDGYIKGLEMQEKLPPLKISPRNGVNMMKELKLKEKSNSPKKEDNSYSK